jgi:hypothetical protein
MHAICQHDPTMLAVEPSAHVVMACLDMERPAPGRVLQHASPTFACQEPARGNA